VVTSAAPVVAPRARAKTKEGTKEPTVDFPGLVDVVLDEKTGQVQFWCKHPLGGGRLHFVQTVVQPNTDQWIAPELKYVPWQLPRRPEVERWYAEDTNEAYFEALCAWIDAEVQLPKPSHTTLLAAWIAHTFIVDLVHASPYILALGPPETGKTRLLEVCIHAARRGVLLPDAREAALIRFTNDFQATLALDTIDFMAAIKSCKDFFAARTKNNGTVTTRVVDYQKSPFKGGMCHFNAYGATLVASNTALSNEVIASRTLPIQMREVHKPGRQPITPTLALPLRERGTAFRARMLQLADRKALPPAPTLAPGRLGDILSGLALAIDLCAPARVSVLRELLEEFAAARRADVQDTVEIELLQQCIDVFEEAGSSGEAVRVLLKTLVYNVNLDRQESGDGVLSGQKASGILRTHLGIVPSPGAGNRRYLTLSLPHLTGLAQKYGLRPPVAKPPGSLPSVPTVMVRSGHRRTDASAPTSEQVKDGAGV
jgi:hypothetical protein